MSTVPTPARAPKRHALGLPQGSVRATHTLLIVGLFCATLLVRTREVLPIPPYLIYLLFMVLGHYFAHRSTSESEHAPLYLPRGFIRLVVILALAGTIGWCLYSDPDRLELQYEKSLDALKNQPYLPLFILGGFFLGIIVRAILSDERPLLLQDLQAWFSLISIVGLCVAGVIHIIIMPSVEEAISLPTWEAILAAIVAFYFGERS